MDDVKTRNKAVRRFLRYVSFNTQSDPRSTSFPSTRSQLVFGRILLEELKELGIKDIELDPNGYLYAFIPASPDYKYKNKLGFIAHMDTSPDFNCKDISPRIIKNYKGQDIFLCEDKILSPKEFPELNDYIGQNLIVTDGKSLLGADDKAGIAEIITAVEYIINNDIKHGPISIAFTPDEEIGRGAERFDIQKFNCDLAFTVDGGQVGELQYENFNAAEAKITIYGKNIHPGEAKNIMLNSVLIANSIVSRFPANETPAHTENYEGFYHLSRISGSVSKTELEYIIRDFDKNNFNTRKNFIKSLVLDVQKEYNCKIDLELKDQYYNMREKIDDSLISFTRAAFKKTDIIPIENPIRGGTDGAMLSYKNLPCPNIFTGGHNFHGPYEFIPINSIAKAIQLIINIATSV